MTTELDNFILNTHPSLYGNGSHAAQHEIHIFLAPLNPDATSIQNYYAAVDEWNSQHQPAYAKLYGDYKMKACLLCLVYRNADFSEKPIVVMQSAVYIKTDSMQNAIAQAHAQHEYFQKCGFTVIREKIEAMAYGITGIPRYAGDLTVYEPNGIAKSPYFEFHIKCAIKHNNDTDNEWATNTIAVLKSCSNIITSNYGNPCPLSYNLNAHSLPGDNLGHQQFFNIRFRDRGIAQIEPELRNVKELLSAQNIDVIKTISEYVWYDTNTQLDAGWIDFNENEKYKLLDFIKCKQISK